jgi:hypothetical protein
MSGRSPATTTSLLPLRSRETVALSRSLRDSSLADERLLPCAAAFSTSAAYGVLVSSGVRIRHSPLGLQLGGMEISLLDLGSATEDQGV